MKKPTEDLNPRCKKISEVTEEKLFEVSAGAETLAWNMKSLARWLANDFAICYEGLVWINHMSARVEGISNEIMELINQLENKFASESPAEETNEQISIGCNLRME